MTHQLNENQQNLLNSFMEKEASAAKARKSSVKKKNKRGLSGVILNRLYWGTIFFVATLALVLVASLSYSVNQYRNLASIEGIEIASELLKEDSLTGFENMESVIFLHENEVLLNVSILAGAATIIAILFLLRGLHYSLRGRNE